jgi:hypothetical protein
LGCGQAFCRWQQGLTRRFSFSQDDLVDTTDSTTGANELAIPAVPAVGRFNQYDSTPFLGQSAVGTGGDTQVAAVAKGNVDADFGHIHRFL